ncbi:Ig-like domain-containing protein [Longimicrobium sp.]|uniref:Ig-like domain-containing protein n=1 Tax=Longimicrobium sp. TaxID=2029185 RepID=UPI002E2EC87B|nr:Ig-like domain-containing protein [Longimicrobium sp.]HEX6039382.1 Ig-like domain-containing protein [Longimicrobium sp.]
MRPVIMGPGGAWTIGAVEAGTVLRALRGRAELLSGAGELTLDAEVDGSTALSLLLAEEMSLVEGPATLASAAEVEVRVGGLSGIAASATVEGSLAVQQGARSLIYVLLPGDVEGAPPAAATVVVLPSSAEVDEGSTVQLAAVVLSEDGVELADSVTWSSVSPAVAGVDATGLVTALGNGEVEVRATAPNGVYGSCVVTVYPVVATVVVTPDPAAVAEGSTLQLVGTARDSGGDPLEEPLTWATSAAAVATVSSTGLVTGVSGGAAQITAQAANGVAGTTSLTVTKPAVYTADFTTMADGAPAGMTTLIAGGSAATRPTSIFNVTAARGRFLNGSSNEHGAAVRDGTAATQGVVRTSFQMSQLRAGFAERGGGLILLATLNASAPLGFTGCRVHTDLSVDTGQFTLLSDCYNQAGVQVNGPGSIVLATIAGLTVSTVLHLEGEFYYAGSVAHLRVRLWKDGGAMPAWPASGSSVAGATDYVMGTAMAGTWGRFGVANRGVPPRYLNLSASGLWV